MTWAQRNLLVTSTARQRYRKDTRAALPRRISHLSHVSLQVHVHALSSFSKMSFNVFPSKGQKRIHAYIESTFRILEKRGHTISQGRLAKQSRYREREGEGRRMVKAKPGEGHQLSQSSAVTASDSTDTHRGSVPRNPGCRVLLGQPSSGS